VLVALDPASFTGVAFGEVHGPPELQVIRLKERGNTLVLACGNAADWWIRMIERLSPIDALAIEAPITVTWGKTNHDTMALAQGLYAIFTGIADAHRIKVMSVTVRSWRAHFLGTAKLPRQAAKERALLVCKHLGWETHGNDNAADAAGIWDYARGLLKTPGLLEGMHEGIRT
jgi:hypothetical protein